MSLPLVLLCSAAAALIAVGMSLVVGLALSLARSWLRERAPAAQARVFFAASVAPAVVTAVVMTAALSPTLGWIADHCHTMADPHGHPHICAHVGSQLPAIPIIVLGALFGARMLFAFVSASALALSAWRGKLLLARASEMPPPGCAALSDTLILPLDIPRGFVVGLFRPQVFLTRGLLGPEAREHADAIVAHEKAHVRRGDPLWRVLANIALAFHLPTVASRVRQSLARAQERAADEVAAQTVGNREQVASALVFVARHGLAKGQSAGVRMPRGEHAFGPTRESAAGAIHGTTDLEPRVRALLNEPSRSHAPGKTALAMPVAAFIVAVAGGAGIVHHGVEVVLGLLSH